MLVEEKMRVWNGHTDGSAPSVSGFVQESTGRPKDLSAHAQNPTLLLLPIKDISGQPVLDKDGNPLIINQVDQWDLGRARASGEKLVNLAAFLNPISKQTGKYGFPEELLTTYFQHHLVYDELLWKGQGRIAEVSNRAQLNQVLAGSQLGMLRSVEGVYGEFDLKDIDIMVTRGVSIWCVMWNFDNPDTGKTAATTGSPEDTGLSLKGKELITHLAVNRRVAVDLAHASDETTENILDITENGVPAIATHSGSRTVTNHKRNLTDAHAKRIAEQGGIIGIPFVDIFVGKSVEGAIEHIEHFAALGILDHVTLGPDFDGMSTLGLVKGLENPETAYKNIATLMAQKGFTDENIKGVLFENALRYLQTHLFPK